MRSIGLFTVLLVVLGCHEAHPPSERVARDFVSAYYVEIDLAKALHYADGLAASKISESLRLTEGVPPGTAARKPRVETKLLRSEHDSLGDRYLFELTIKPDDFPQIIRKTMIRVHGQGAEWKVAQFYDDAVPSPEFLP